jgi:hypothetical protein
LRADVGQYRYGARADGRGLLSPLVGKWSA